MLSLMPSRDLSPQLKGSYHALVERFFNKIKQCRRVATRYDKLAANYLVFVQLASIRLWLRVNVWLVGELGKNFRFCRRLRDRFVPCCPRSPRQRLRGPPPH